MPYAAADAATFLADFGVAVTWQPSSGAAAVAGLMIFDTPDADIAGGEVISRQYLVTFESAAWPNLKRNEQLVIDGAAYQVNTKPDLLADGLFASVGLSKL